MAKSSRRGGWPAKRLAGFGSQAGRDASRQRPGQHGQAQRLSRADGRLGCGPVVGMAGDAGVIENQQPAGTIPIG